MLLMVVMIINVLIVVTEVMITHVMVVKLMLRLSTLRTGGDHPGGGAVDDQHDFFLQDNMRDDEPFSGEFQRLERLACDTIQRRTEVFNFQSYPHYRHHQIALS